MRVVPISQPLLKTSPGAFFDTRSPWLQCAPNIKGAFRSGLAGFHFYFVVVFWLDHHHMGRWTQYDEDNYRLPEGIERIGYDADAGCYYFRDREGLLYKGPEGSEFGELTQVKELPVAVSAGDSDNDVEAASTRGDGYQPLAVDENGARHVLRGGAYRTLFPFFLIIAVVLLLVWRLAFSPTLATPAPCPSTTIPHTIQPGDTCWNIVRQHNSTLDKFRIVNPKIVCSDLRPGDRVCVPDEGSSISRIF